VCYLCDWLRDFITKKLGCSKSVWGRQYLRIQSGKYRKEMQHRIQQWQQSLCVYVLCTFLSKLNDVNDENWSDPTLEITQHLRAVSILFPTVNDKQSTSIDEACLNVVKRSDFCHVKPPYKLSHCYYDYYFMTSYAVLTLQMELPPDDVRLQRTRLC